MKAAILLWCASLSLALFGSALFAQEAPPPTATPTPAPAAQAPAVPVVQVPLTPEAFEAKALKWISVVGSVGTALLGVVAFLWAKVQDLKARMDRQSQKTGSLETRLTAVAMATPAGAEALKNAPADPVAAIAKEKRAGGMLGVAILAPILTATALLASGCATDTGNAERDARGRATNQALAEAAKVLGRAATSALFTVATEELAGHDADFGQAAATGLWGSVNTTDTAAAVSRVVQAYSGNRAPTTAAKCGATFRAATAAGATPAETTNAIAAVVSTAAGAPPTL